MNRRRLAPLLFALFAGVGAASCSSDSGSGAQPPAADTSASASTASSTEAADTTAVDATVSTEAPVTTDAPPETAAPTTASAEETTTTTVELGPPFDVDIAEETFVDETRAADGAVDSTDSPSRTLATRIKYPLAPGPFPLIVFAHGLTGSPDNFDEMTTQWAAAGYVVAAPAFPLTNGTVPDAYKNLADIANQPGDVSFVIDNVLALAADDQSPLYGRVDIETIGLSGHSFGAGTTFGTVYGTCCQDPRIDAAIILAGFNPFGDNMDFTRELPILIVHGDNDPVLNVALDDAIYPLLAGPKWYVTFLGADHSLGFDNPAAQQHALLEQITSEFWNGTLGADATQLDALETDAVVDGVATLQHAE